MNEPFTTYVVTDCPLHGVKVVSDLDSFIAYVAVAQECDRDRNANRETHMLDHDAAQESCWTCCRYMQIDPYGLLDY